MFFRLLLVIPHAIVLLLWGIAFMVVVLVNWFATLFAGRSPQGMHDLEVFCLRYSTQTNAYLFLLTERYPSLANAPA